MVSLRPDHRADANRDAVEDLAVTPDQARFDTTPTLKAEYQTTDFEIVTGDSDFRRPAQVKRPIPARRIQLAGYGLVFGLIAFAVNVLGFFLTLGECRAENQTHYSGACPPIDDHPGWFAWVGVVGASAALPLLGSLGLRTRLLLAATVLPWLFWLAYIVVLSSM